MANLRADIAKVDPNEHNNCMNITCGLKRILVIVLPLIICGTTLDVSGFDLFGLAPKWETFSSKVGRYSVSLPGKPKESVVKGNSTIGEIVDMHFALLEVSSGEIILYGTGYGDESDVVLKNASVKEILDAGRDGAVAGCQGRLLLEFIITLDGHPGRELKVALPTGHTAKIRLFLVNKRKYSMMVVSTPKGAYYKDVTRFFDSFKLK